MCGLPPRTPPLLAGRLRRAKSLPQRICSTGCDRREGDAALSVFPVAEQLGAPQAEAGLSVAELATRIRAAYPGVEQIKRAASGRITAYWFDGGAPGSAVIDPATGQGVASADPDQTERWLTNLHRSLFLGDAGRIAAAAGAAAMLVLSLS